MKKKLKKQINQTVRSVFIYYLILVGVSFLYILWKSTVVSGQTGAGVFSGQMMKYAADKAGFSVLRVLRPDFFIWLSDTEKRKISGICSVQRTP